MDSNSLAQNKTSSSIFTCIHMYKPGIKPTQRRMGTNSELLSPELIESMKLWPCKIHADHVKRGVQQILHQNLKRPLAHGLRKSRVRRFYAEPHGSEMYKIPCCAILQLPPPMFTPELAQSLAACPRGPAACSSSPNGGVTRLHNSGGTATLKLH